MAFKHIRIFLEMIKFEHSVFALPFAYLGAFLAAGSIPAPAKLFWITMAMVGARTAAMSLNRLIDRRIDALNPRTANRALPRKLVSVTGVWVSAWLSFGLLLLAAWRLNPLCLKLFPVALFVLTIYSYTKRWTWACHFVLGLADGLAPLGAWVAVRGSVDGAGILLGLAVALWVAGFDIIYACQDLDFDRKFNIHSIPARFGLGSALATSRLVHGGAILSLMSVGLLLHLGLFYWIGLFASAALLYYEHHLVSPANLTKLGIAFLNVNGYLSITMFIFVLLDILTASRFV